MGLLFDNCVTTPHDTLRKVISACMEWENAQSKKLKPQLFKNLAPPALHPDLGTIVCYTDAAWKADREVVGLSWIFTDHASNEILDAPNFRMLWPLLSWLKR